MATCMGSRLGSDAAGVRLAPIIYATLCLVYSLAAMVHFWCPSSQTVPKDVHLGGAWTNMEKTQFYSLC